jgi:linoleoyl-CoA desaturase
MLSFVVVPMVMVGVINTLIGYAIVTLSCGIVIAIVFQLAHVVGEASFHHTDEKEELGNVEWAVHQINTTSNFAMKSSWVHWFTGGLNYQVEHHLFPRISHVHYPALSGIVQATCKKFGVRYNAHRTIFSAVRAHVVHLKEIGRG